MPLDNRQIKIKMSGEIRSLRKIRGLSLREVSDHTGLSQANITAAEKGDAERSTMITLLNFLSDYKPTKNEAMI